VLLARGCEACRISDVSSYLISRPFENMERPLDQSYPIFPRTPVPSLMSFTSCMRKLHTTYAKTSSSTLHPSVLPSHSPQLATSTPTSLRRTSPSTPLPTRGASRATHIRAIRLANTRITRTRIQRVVSALFLSCSFGLLGARLVGVKGSIGVRGTVVGARLGVLG
jgi:hypothetical protein